MTAPRLGQGMPANDAWFAEQIKNLQRQITELAAARTLNASTIDPNGTLTINGTLDVTGNTVIGGTLSLPAGIINNDALTSPVEVAIANGSSGGFTFTGTPTVYETVNVSVPAGFSQALVMAIATAGMSANSSGGSGLAVAARINGVLGQSIGAGCATLSGMSVSAPFAMLVTGLSGGTFPIDSLASASIPANVFGGSCNAQVSASILFLR